MDNQNKNTHANKATSYNIGRPAYPDDFYEYVCEKIGITPMSTMADIGAGTGKVTKGFLKKGIEVIAIEPDQDMFHILKQNTNEYTNCASILTTAADTKIQTASVDCIFCGNSYHWFDRNDTIPEFQRIVKNSDIQRNIIITSLGPHDNAYTEEFIEIDRNFSKTVTSGKANFKPCFLSNTFVSKVFEYSVFNDYSEFLHGALSASNAPVIGESGYEEYCEALKKLFEKYSIDGKVESKFKLSCMIGNVNKLAY